MVFVPALNVAQVELRAEYLDENIENVLYFQRDSAIDAASVDDLCAAINADFGIDSRTVQSSSYILNEMYVTDLTTASSPTYTVPLVPPQAGDEAGSPGMPGSVAMCASFRTAGRGRSARGRNYFAGVTENNVVGNVLNSLFISTVLDAYRTMLPGGTLPADWTWIVLSRYTAGAPRASGLIQPVTAVISTDDKVDSQRGRLR